MAIRTFDKDAPFQSIRHASYLTGLAVGYIRRGCKDGVIPHIMVGGEYRVNMPLFLQQLNDASTIGGSSARLVLK